VNAKAGKGAKNERIDGRNKGIKNKEVTNSGMKETWRS